jgi:hypothetical protein
MMRKQCVLVQPPLAGEWLVRSMQKQGARAAGDVTAHILYWLPASKCLWVAINGTMTHGCKGHNLLLQVPPGASSLLQHAQMLAHPVCSAHDVGRT